MRGSFIRHLTFLGIGKVSQSLVFCILNEKTVFHVPNNTRLFVTSEGYELARCPTLLPANIMFCITAEQMMYPDQETLGSSFCYFALHVIDKFDKETSQQRNTNFHSIVSYGARIL